MSEYQIRMIGELPEGWSLAPLGEVASDEANSFVDGPFGSDLKVSDYTEAGVRILQLQNLGDGEFVNKNKIYTSEAKARLVARCITKPGDIIIAKMAEPLARAVVVPHVEEKFLIVADLMKLRVSAKNDPTFVKNAINAPVFRREAERLSTGTTRTRISLSVLKKIGLPSPSFQEQRKIAKILSTVDNIIEKTQALIDKYQSIKQGMMHDLFTRGIDENRQLRPSYKEAPHLYKESELGWIPNGWEVETLSGFAQSPSTCVNGPFGSDLLTSELKEEGVPVIYIRDIKPGHYKRKSTTHVTEQKANQIAFCNVRKGDVLLSKVGDPPCDAAPYLEEERSIVTQDVIRIRPGSDVDSYFLTYLINSSVGRNSIRRIIIEGTRARVSLTELKRTLFAKPPFAEQVAIGKRLKTLQDRIFQEEDLVCKMLIVKSGLMQDLLEGRVRVKVDT